MEKMDEGTYYEKGDRYTSVLARQAVSISNYFASQRII
jgi:hypothetical protein